MGDYLADKVVDIRFLNVEDASRTVFVNYTKIYANGQKETRRVNVKNLSGFYDFFTPKPIVAAELLGKVYVGILRDQCYLLFVVRLEDGSVQIIKASEGSKESLILLQLNDDAVFKSEQPVPVRKPENYGQPYRLNQNELPQGTYLVGRDIPPGVYDFFVVYGHGGQLEFKTYDSDGELNYETWKSYWVGGKESYEHREVVHVKCDEGCKINISGNVILKIARSQKVQINL